MFYAEKYCRYNQIYLPVKSVFVGVQIKQRETFIPFSHFGKWMSLL